MKICKLFIASSMKNFLRSELDSIEDEVNIDLESRGLEVRCEVVAYSHRPIVDCESDTQEVINDIAAKSDIFILIANNSDVIGKYTMQELDTAESQYKNSGAPLIKAFVAKVGRDDAVSVSYRDVNDAIYNDFTNYYEKSGRYVEYVLMANIRDYIQDWLIVNIENIYYGSVQQSSLSYCSHIYKIKQGGIRMSDNKYYRRENVDGEIERKLSKSPIVILEGNTYSGKTRAAYEFMRNNKEWENYRFHIYNCNYSIDDLNAIIPNMSTNRRNGLGDVYLIDDINEILDKGEINITGHNLWAKLAGYNSGNGFTLESMGSTRIIITISGRLSSRERERVYQKIFSTRHPGTLKKITEDVVVKFDIYDKISFRKMVDDMVRDGIISNKKVVKGNYTIGSLFIESENVENEIREFLEASNEDARIVNPQMHLLCALVGHYKYAIRSKFFALKTEIKDLYESLGGNLGEFDQYVDDLRKRGLVVVDGESVFVDMYIIDLFTQAIFKYGSKSVKDINEYLINYAAKCQKLRSVSDCNMFHIYSICQMGYLLCDRNTLSDEEIDGVISLVKEAYGNRIIPILLNDETTDRYRYQFFATAYARYNNFNKSAQMIQSIYKGYIKNVEMQDSLRNLYKRTIFAMLSSSNRVMTLGQEREILSFIFEEDGAWKEPFSKDDLNDIFNLVRISPFMKLNPEAIIDYATHATIDGLDMNYRVEERSQDMDSDNEFCYTSEDGVDEMIDASNNYGDHFYERVYLNQISLALISALCKVRSYQEFEDVLDLIDKGCAKSDNVQKAVQQAFPFNFYMRIKDIAMGLSYEDRYKLFKYVAGLTHDSAILGSSLIDNNIIRRTHALNRLLELLDGNDVLTACEMMLEKKLSDNRTFSIMLKNEFVSFEQILPLIEKYDKEKNFITLNQIMRAAETASDANACMHLMGITNDNPSKLKDEYALSQYLRINGVSKSQMIVVLKGWRELYPQNKLSESALNIVLHKYSIDDLFEITMGEIYGDDNNYYKDKYGLVASEIKLIRDNAKLINIVFKTANKSNNEADVGRINQLFKDIVNDPNRCNLITDSNQDADNSILSVYLKNKTIFPTYDRMKQFADEFIAKYNIRKSGHLYMVYLFEQIRCGGMYESVNTLLNEAYGDFANNYTRSEIAKMMPRLYSFIPLVVNGDFDDPRKFAYNEGYATVDGRNEITFKEYLKFLFDNAATYVDGTFIYNTLRTMSNSIDEDVFEMLCQFAQRNHCGIKSDTIFKKSETGSRFILSDVVRNRLMGYVDGEFRIDTNLVTRDSRCKILMFMIARKKMTFEQAERYREDNNIPITQTYLNFAVKEMESHIKTQYKNSGHKDEVLEEGYIKMKKYIEEEVTRVSYLHKSLQMCLSLISVVSNEEELKDIFCDKDFCKYRYRVEVMGAHMNKRLQLSNGKPVARALVEELKKEMQDGRGILNITIVNTYLSALFLILKNEIKYQKEDRCIIDEVCNSLGQCWETLKTENYIDLNVLLNIQASDTEWKMMANVQTYSYFALSCPNLISLMYGKFDGNFNYDERERKSCLKDAVKNYAFAYEYNDYPFDEVKFVSKVFAKDSKAMFIGEELIEEYILRSKNHFSYGKMIWNKMYLFWSDILWYPEFKQQFIHHVCHMAMDMANYKGNSTPKLARLNMSDTQRVNSIREEVVIQCLRDNMQDDEYIDGNEKLRQGFATCIQKVEDCRIKIDKIITCSKGRPNEKYAKQAKEIIEKLFF